MARYGQRSPRSSAIYVLVFGCLAYLGSPARVFAALCAILVLHALAPAWVPCFSQNHYTDALKVGMFFMGGVAVFPLLTNLIIRPRYALPLLAVAALL